MREQLQNILLQSVEWYYCYYGVYPTLPAIIEVLYEKWVVFDEYHLLMQISFELQIYDRRAEPSNLYLL